MIKVNRRERKLKKSTALYLDYYIGSERIQEPTNLHIYPGKDERTKQLNKDNNIRFEILRNERQAALLNGVASLPVNRSKVDFYKYYEQYFEKYKTKERRAAAVLQKLKAYSKSPALPITLINDSFLLGFKSMLEATLTGETPHNYFKLLAKVLRHATKQGYFTSNPADDVVIKRQEGAPKETLTMDELKMLAATRCSNDGVKRAFLFCAFTGLRYCDVSKLTWQHISGGKLAIIQAKTSKLAAQDLHETALQMLGKAGVPTDKVFALPTSLNGCNKVLKYWVKQAGIDKNITWHCARHSAATNLALHGADIVGIAAVLGHASIKYTQRYTTRSLDTLSRKAIQTLPAL